MTNLNTIEKLRTRKEVEDYFKQIGKEITEEELDALKKSYDKAQESSGALTMQQLDDVAGGFYVVRKPGKFRIRTGQIKVGDETAVHLSFLGFYINSDGTISFDSNSSSEVAKSSRERILQDPRFLPVFSSVDKTIYCFPIDRNGVPENLNTSVTQMKISAKECIKVYLKAINAQTFIDNFTSEKDFLPSEYDRAQLTNIEGLVEAAK